MKYQTGLAKMPRHVLFKKLCTKKIFTIFFVTVCIDVVDSITIIHVVICV
jgi:hypothetical protein